jgi:histidine kinase/DNA gyrase B/HSP90-like ATPase
MEELELKIDAGRLLFGLSRIGYTTSSAICDIIDNSVRAKAENIHLLVRKKREDLADSRKNNVSEYVVIDDGAGMNSDQILEALKLGSSDDDYDINSLSKFGLGLKSAAFSQADVLKIISSDGSSEFKKYVVSLPEVISKKLYFTINTELDADDLELIKTYLPQNKGTIIKLSNVRKINHPSVNNTIKELNLKVGVIYYYFIKDGLNITIASNKINAIDPLFVSEAEGNLNENEWDGTKVQWIENQKKLVLDQEFDVSCQIEITQLPYPPIFKIRNELGKTDLEIRKHYQIASGNYGFYVYRNKRLIAWASSLDGIIPPDQDYFAFRGRILIEDNADDYFNIDVKKSTLTISDEAFSSISDFVQEAKYKSRQAWKNAGKILKDFSNKEPHEIANNVLEDFDQIDILPGDELLEPEDAKSRIESLSKDMIENAKQLAIMLRQDNGEDVVEGEEKADMTRAEIDIAVRGGDNPKATKIFKVTSVIDNLLWEPYYDTDLKNCVRINKLHRFGRYIFEENSENKDLQVIFELMLLQFAESELYAYKSNDKYSYEELKPILTEYRRITSEFLANMCRKLDGKIPPFKSIEE